MELNGVSQELLSPVSIFDQMFNNQLLVCCIKTLLSPSYVQLASFSLRNSLNLAANNNNKKKCNQKKLLTIKCFKSPFK